MAKTASPTAGYLMVAGLGVLAGGLLVGLVARAIPRAMSRAMNGMMRQMMECGGESGHGMPDT
jgi:hypothetical protein